MQMELYKNYPCNVVTLSFEEHIGVIKKCYNQSLYEQLMLMLVVNLPSKKFYTAYPWVS